MLAPVRTVDPASPVVTLEAVKQHLRVDHTDDDAVISAFIQAATDHLDGWSGILGRALVNQTWRQDFGGFHACAKLRLPLAPVIQAPTVSYFDADNVQQTLSATVWQVLTDALGPYVALKPGQSWPTAYARPDAVSVTFVAGYGAAGTDVPVALQTAIILHVKMNYDPESRSTIAPAFDALVAPYSRVGV